jgi:AbrB family looped-hinge helix DNA binding protein
MQTVRVSARFEILIPRALRQQLGIEPGQELFVSVSDGSLVLKPRPTKASRDITELRGAAKGIKWLRTDRDRGTQP